MPRTYAVLWGGPRDGEVLPIPRPDATEIRVPISRLTRSELDADAPPATSPILVGVYRLARPPREETVGSRVGWRFEWQG